jgi:hypothetical protein
MLALMLTGAKENTETSLESAMKLPCDNDTVWMESHRLLAKRLNNKSQRNANVGTEFILESANQVPILPKVTNIWLHIFVITNICNLRILQICNFLST